MSEQYICKSVRRLEAVRDGSTLNGIDYLEVLDHDAPLGSPKQQTLLVRCLQPVLTLTDKNVLIEGGVRITPVRVQWVHAAGGVPVPPATPAEQAFFSALPSPDHVLVVRTDVSGDFSTYTLRLIASPADTAPPVGFDPELSAVEFSFKVECPSEFDCRTVAECPPEVSSQPVINYLAKDYGSFRRLMLDRLAVTMPAWTERHPADMGVMLVELLAYAADRLSYYQDAVATEAYLGTARRRISVRRHARLLDYPMHDGCNARAWVHVRVAPGGPVPLQAGTTLLTQTTAPRGPLLPNRLDAALREGALAFETVHDATFVEANNEMHFYTWSNDDCCLPKGATRATLRNDSGQIQLSPGDVLVFAERVSPVTGVDKDADPARRWAVRLTGVTAGQDPLTKIAVVEIEWHAGDALPFPFCLSAVSSGTNVPIADVSVAYGNIVLADHGLTVQDEPLSPANVTDAQRYRPGLSRRGITFSAPDDAAPPQGPLPAGEVLRPDPRAAMPAVSLSKNGEPWTARRDLLGSSRFALHFVAETEDDGTVRLRFGDGILGAEPVSGLRARYRVGSGAAGNVGAEAIAHAVTAAPGIRDVRNPLPAQGGIDPEPIEQVRLYAPQAFRTQERAVTEQDYAAVAERHPEVQRAEATLRWTGSWYTMFVTVERRHGRQVDPPFRQTVRDFLERFRLAGYDLEIEAPIFVPLDIAMTVCVASGYFRTDVATSLLQVFSNRDLPDGRRGFFHPDNFTFGQPVYLSQLVATAMQLAGVLWVDTDDHPPAANRFRRWGRASSGETAAGRIGFERLEIARLDNNPSMPENGKIEFYMKGGL